MGKWGGDSSKLKTTNISTISAFVLASMGVKVAKHGGRAVSSISGSLDFLSALGILEIDPIVALEKFGVCFLDARKYHNSFKYIAPFLCLIPTTGVFFFVEKPPPNPPLSFLSSSLVVLT